MSESNSFKTTSGTYTGQNEIETKNVLSNKNIREATVQRKETRRSKNSVALHPKVLITESERNVNFQTLESIEEQMPGLGTSSDVPRMQFRPGKNTLRQNMINWAALRPGEKPPDVNEYQNKKTAAQGMMDLALICANASQMRYVLTTNGTVFSRVMLIILLLSSIILQAIIGVCLCWNMMFDVKKEKEVRHANKINNFTCIGSFLVSFINVIVSTFGVSD